ncbi:MAG: hypothetical protein AAF829_04995 [Pseudomonadota bacterium]
MTRYALPIAIASILAGCTTASVGETEPTSTAPAEAFLQNLQSICGQAFEGEVVSQDLEDADWRAETLTIHLAVCTADTVRIPLQVGSDRSRTWTIAFDESGVLSLDHQHLHEDGSPDAVTGYGGSSIDPGSAFRQEFPASEPTKALFVAQGIPQSSQNTWAMEMKPEENLFAYEMRRPGRFFRAEFNLSEPVPIPPPPWAAGDPSQ